MQPNEPEERMLGGEESHVRVPSFDRQVRVPSSDREAEQAYIYREGREAELDERADQGWMSENWVGLVLLAAVVAVVVFVLVIALA